MSQVGRLPCGIRVQRQIFEAFSSQLEGASYHENCQGYKDLVTARVIRVIRVIIRVIMCIRVIRFIMCIRVIR